MTKARKMKKEDMVPFRELLLREKTKLEGEVNHLKEEGLTQSQREASGDLSGYSIHMADMGTDDFQREMSLNLASSEEKLLYEVERALRRIDEGSYGICAQCQKRITKKRLKVIPYARLCMKCKQRIEEAT